MALDRILHGSEAPRTEIEAKADRLLPLCANEIASLSDERLAALHKAAREQRFYLECDDSAHVSSSPYWRDLSRVRKLESQASAEMKRRADAQVSVTEGDAELWSGSLTDFFLNNTLEPEEAAEVRECLARDGRATVGGGAAPLFTIIRVDALVGKAVA